MIIQSKRIFVSVLFVLMGLVSSAQNSDDDPPPPGPPTGPGLPLPIDGGVLLGACFAVAYGARKLLKSNN
ncbi:MAG: hypothetical protein ABJL44_19490 [Algibacter sp.]